MLQRDVRQDCPSKRESRKLSVVQRRMMASTVRGLKLCFQGVIEQASTCVSAVDSVVVRPTTNAVRSDNTRAKPTELTLSNQQPIFGENGGVEWRGERRWLGRAPVATLAVGNVTQRRAATPLALTHLLPPLTRIPCHLKILYLTSGVHCVKTSLFTVSARPIVTAQILRISITVPSSQIPK